MLGRTCASEPELTEFIGPPLRTTFKKLLNTHDRGLIEEAVAIYRERYSRVGIFENKVYPGIVELLEALHENSYKLYVVTVKPIMYADRIVRHFSLDHYFTNVFGADLEGHFDDKTELIASILATLKLVPDETIIIGDRKEDIVAGKTNRIRTIAITYGYGSQQEIVSSAPDYICDSPMAIRMLIMQKPPYF